MNREHKLAVVLGFGLLLFVGILVSDHLSAGQRRNAADLAANTQIREVRPAAPISIQTLRVSQPVPANQMASGDLGSGAGQSGDALALPVGLLPNAPTQAAVVGVPAELYILKDGETLYKICQAKYGNGNLWKELADFNKATVSNPTKLRPGMTIRLPSINVLRGELQAVVAVPVQMDASVDQGAPAQALPPFNSRVEYVIQKGDTLGAIASRQLGSAKKWESIYEANRDRMKSPSDLKIGKSLRIPSAS